MVFVVLQGSLRCILDPSLHVVWHSVPCFLRFPMLFVLFFFQAEDGIRYLVRSRGLGDVYKRQLHAHLRFRLGATQGGGDLDGHGERGGVGRCAEKLSLIHI